MVSKISIVTACYNSVTTIEKTILSVIGQSYDNIEYIVVDGASTDGTLDLINKYKDRISVIISEPDCGIYDAMNKGIARATGEWIHFRNSGDYFISKDSVRNFFAKPLRDDVMIVHGDCYYYNDEFYYKQTPPSLRVSYKKQIPVLHPATFVKTELQKSMNFNLKYSSSADYDFFYTCCQKNIKFEYRSIVIVAFEVGGFSSNWERAYMEDSMIQGKFDTIEGKLKCYYYFYMKILRQTIKKCILRHSKWARDREGMKEKTYSFNVDRMRLPIYTDFNE